MNTEDNGQGNAVECRFAGWRFDFETKTFTVSGKTEAGETVGIEFNYDCAIDMVNCLMANIGAGRL